MGRYLHMLSHPNTTSIDVMVDEHVSFDPVQRTHAYEDVPEFDLQAYSVEEIFAEKLRALYQRGAARDYYDLYQLLETDSVNTNFADVGPAFDAKCKHDGLTVDLNDGLPDEQQETIRHQWETTLPDLTGDPPAFEMVWEQLDTAISQQGSS
jgi:predicted nucleotidyltransferase component of viral defense system